MPIVQERFDKKKCKSEVPIDFIEGCLGNEMINKERENGDISLTKRQSGLDTPRKRMPSKTPRRSRLRKKFFKVRNVLQSLHW